MMFMDATIVAALITAAGSIIAAIIGRIPLPQKGETGHGKDRHLKTWLIILSVVLLVISAIFFFIHFKNNVTPPTEPPIDRSEPTTESVTISSENIRIGSLQTIGQFEQDGDESNGAEDLQWIVLRQENDELLLISDLGIRPFHYAQEKTSDWENSSIREWLNGTFYQTAFSSEEKARIVEKTHVQDINEDYPYCEQGSDTTDNVFLLSAKQYIDYMENNVDIKPEQRWGRPSAYAVNEGASLHDGKYCWWWLRTSSKRNETACSVTAYGVLDPRSCSIRSDDILVRPAIWVKIGG